MDTVALMKSLGATQRFVISVATIQLLLLGVLGIAAGSLIGYAAEEALSWMLADIIAADLPDASLMPIVLASVSALVLLVGFALPSLFQLRNTPPLRVLRHDVMPPAPSRILVAGLSITALTGEKAEIVPAPEGDGDRSAVDLLAELEGEASER